MERNVNEGVCEKNDCNLLTKAIFDQSSNEQDTGKCRHFSIRAYVADIRRKDQNICWPFYSFRDSKEPKEQTDMLPPLEVPEFKWWCCQNCLRSTGASDVADITVVPNTTEEKICEGRKTNINTSVDMTGYDCYPMINLDRKEKLVDFNYSLRKDEFAFGEYENSLVKNVDEGISEPTSCETKDAQCLNEEIVIKDAENIDLSFRVGGLDDPGKPNCGICEVDEVGFGNRNSNCASNCSAESCPKGRFAYSFPNIAKISEQQREVITCPQILERMTVEMEVLDSPSSYTSKLSSLKFNENDESKDADNSLDQYLSSQHNNSSRTLIRRKQRKVRLLTDILRSELSGASSKIPNSSGLVISETNVSHTEATDESGDLAIQRHVGKSTVNKKKRKTFQVEDWGPFQMRCSKSGYENVRMYKTDEENNCVDSVIASSASVNEAYPGVNSDAVFKSHSNKRRVDELVSKKKDNESRFEGRQSSSKPWQENLCRDLKLMSRDVESKETGNGTLQFNFSKDATTERGSFPLHKHSVAVPGCDQESNFCVKGNIDKDSLRPCNESMPKEERVVSKNVEISPAKSTSLSLAYAPDAFPGRGGRYMKNEKDTFIKSKDFLFPCDYGNDIDIQGNSEFSKNQSSERANKVCELESLDDIPMEIVELLAENMRHRRLLEAENANPNKIEKNFQVKRKLTSACGGICMGRSVEVGPSEVELMNCPSHYEQTCTTSGSNVNGLLESKGGLASSNSKQFAQAGSGGNFGIQSCRCDGDTLGHNCSIVSCPTRCSEAHHVFFPNDPLKIDRCQKFTSLPPKQNRNFDVRISKKINAEKPCACMQKKIGNGSKPFSTEFGKNYIVGESLDHVSSGPISKACAFSVPKDTKCTRISGITSQNSEEIVSRPIKSRGKAKTKTSCAPKKAFPINGLTKRFCSASNSTVFPLQPQLIKDGAVVEVHEAVGTVRAVKGSGTIELCSVNRNPADFSLLHAGNKFMIGCGDFKPRNKISKRGRPRLTTAYGQKRMRTMK